MSSSKAKPGAKLYQADPVAASDGAVSSWFSFAHPSSVITGSGYSSVHDILNPSSPATQSVDGRRPPSATSANGLPIVTVSVSVLAVPLIAARMNTATWGFWAWVKPTNAADGILSFGTNGGASANFLWFNFNSSATNSKSEVWSGAQSRIMNKGSLTPGSWRFLTLEYNSSFSGDARFILTLDGVVQSGTFSGTLGSMPAALQSGVTGSGSLLSFGSAVAFPFVGSFGTNFGFLASAMANVSTGLLTQQARLSLMNYQRPT
jgi:hypothetical protein